MTVLGHWLIILAGVGSVGAAAGYARLAFGRPAGPFHPRLLATLSGILVAAASAVLLSLLLSHDYANGYVFGYSDNSLPWYYLISSFYAGQEGSFLFWALCSAIIAFLLGRSARTLGSEGSVMAVYMTIQTCLLLLVVTKSPFRPLWDVFSGVQAGFVPPDGRGLNPLLQNFWMVIHPPVLFLGFAAMAVPFSFMMGGWWRKEYDLLERGGTAWLLFGCLVLGLGIMLGAYWAYGVLGWGGYWGWDPVENSSLVPWLTGVALLHTILAQRRTGGYVRTNAILAALTFFLVMYSTFLTRSGILGDASVHAFTDPGAGVYWLLLIILALIAVASLAMIGAHWHASRGTTLVSGEQIATREASLGGGAIALLMSACVVLFGTSLPIFSTIRAEGSFYDMTNLPIAVAIVLLIGYSLYTQWQAQDVPDLVRRNARALTIALVAGVLIYLLGARSLKMLALIIASLFAVVVNVDIAVRVARGRWRFLGGKLAHIGIALFFLGVVATGKYATTQRLSLVQDVPQNALGRTFTFTGLTVRPDGKTAFAVRTGHGSSSTILEPLMFQAGEQGIMKTPDILSSMSGDVYLSPLSYDEPSGGGMEYRLAKGETIEAGGGKIRFTGFQIEGGHNAMMQAKDGSMRVGSNLDITRNGSVEAIVLSAIIRPGKRQEFPPVHSSLLHADLRLAGMSIGEGTAPAIMLDVRDSVSAAGRGLLVVEASVKPLIILLWSGSLVMFAGFVLAMAKRWEGAKG